MTKTVLITGTSSGYGKAIAELFLASGWNVIATMRRPETDIIAGPSDRLKIVRLDVTDAASIAAAIAESIAHFGSLDVLVNIAVIGLAS